MNKVVVVGSANTDMIVQAERLPGPGETVLGGRFATAQGGKGANQAIAAARLGAQVTFVARLGQDALGDQARSYARLHSWRNRAEQAVAGFFD